MYKQIATEDQFATEYGGVVTPVASLADEYGGKAHIAVDDHRYVLYQKVYGTDRYRLDRRKNEEIYL